MKRAVLFIMATALLCFSGCAKKDEATALEKIQKKLINLDSFSATALVTQISNKGEKAYEVTQDAKKSGEYRIVVTSPEKIAGTVTVFDGSVTFQYNPRVDGSLKIDLPVSQLRNELLLTSFVKNYLNSEDVTVEVSKMEGATSTVLEAVIPGANPYMKTEKLWVDNETLMPVKLVIYDEANSERIVVTYKKIEYNTKLESSIFAIPETRSINADAENEDNSAEAGEAAEADESAETSEAAETIEAIDVKEITEEPEE